MLYTTFGNTGIELSRLGFGAMRFERPDKIDEMAAVVLRASELGVTYFDTAPGYCDDHSESIVGAAVKEMKRRGRPFYISTKSGAADPDTIRRQCETSLKRLHVDAIDFYHVWCLVHPGELLERKAKGALKAFQQLKDEGLVRHVSVSTHLEHHHVETMLDQGGDLFESMLIGLNAQNHHLRYPGVQAAARRGMGVVTMNTLGGGILTKYPERFSVLMRSGDTSMVDAALRFNLSLPEIHVALVGFRNIADVESAVAAVEGFTPMDHAETARLSAAMAGAYREFCTQCGYCAECPQGIPVVRLMEAYNRGMLEGMDKAVAHMRYHWNESNVPELLAACTQCRECEEVCTQQLPILERFETLKQAHQQAQSE